MQFLKETHIKFTEHSTKAISVSLLIIFAGLISLIFVRGLNYSIDFTGGTLNHIKFEKEVEPNNIRRALENSGIDKSVVQGTNHPQEYFIRLPKYSEEGGVADQVKEALTSLDPNYETLSTKGVGPQIGEELRRNATFAIIGALVVIGLYISFRFKFYFALGAVAALIHDVLFTLGIFSFTQMEISISTIAAFLTIVGYSLNDTIVLYDRIRENMQTKKRFDIRDLIDNSINQVLSRTIITSLTTLFVVVVLSFAFGEVKIFAYAMVIGVITGTFSSIYVAGPVLIAWQKKIKTSS
ncbi:MAG: protein translocase subunit SecF [Candidatus Marinimicrobia bacterium]|nr:protein translocase subunit SecF [Candidatus Neomarinimicrobiota bacterium]